LRPPGAAPGFRPYKSPRMTVILRALRMLFLFLFLFLLSYYLFPGGVVLGSSTSQCLRPLTVCV